jgi:hypothetical protein
MGNNLFGNKVVKPDLELNIYADEAMNRKCPYTGENWHYMCLIFERLDSNSNLLEDIIKERFLNNFDKSSPYYKKNNKILHWTNLGSTDGKNICKRWFDYILDPIKSGQKFYSYILGLNETYLNKEEFDPRDKFGSVYNRFFRSTIEYGVKTFFLGENFNKIIIKNIYHEQGQQQYNPYFPWHPIDKLSKETSFIFKSQEITFLTKDHNINPESNILQLCDCFLGAVVNIIHGLKNPNSNRAKVKKELIDLILPLIQRIMENPSNKNSKYQYANRIIIRSFPKDKTLPTDDKRKTFQYYTKRKMKYLEDKSKQLSLF